VRRRVFCAWFFEFEVGFQRLAAHKSLVSRTSPALSALVKNGRRDSSEKLASIPDVDEATFARFVEFLYTGDYNAAKLLRNQEALRATQHVETDLGKEGWFAQEIVMGLESDPPPDAPPAIEEPADFDERVAFGMSKKEKKRIRQRDSATSIRRDRPTPQLPQPDFKVAVVSPLPTSSLLDHHDSADGSDYTAFFLCHAKLYVLAEKYGVEPM